MWVWNVLAVSNEAPEKLVTQAVVGLCGPHFSGLYSGTVHYPLSLANGLLGESEKPSL